jgi:putative ABC transport system permease protein
MRTVYQDLRYGLRLLARSPAFTLVAVTTLAVGIAANTAVFGWIDSVLLRPLPGTAAGDRLVIFELIDRTREGFNISYPDFRDFRDNLKLSTVAVSLFPSVLELGEGEHTQRVWGELVSGNYFEVMGVEPLMGRFFLPEEQGDAPPASPIAVVSERLWRTRLGADPDVVGRVVRLNHHRLTIVGVAPAAFRGTVRGMLFDVWIPLTMAPQLGRVDASVLENRRARMLNAVARLAPGVTIEQARAEVASVAERLARLHPDTNTGFGATLVWEWDAHASVQPFLRGPLEILMATCALVLLIACANVASLLVARATARQRETSIRLVLGASRARLLRQMLTESALLLALGALVGVPLATWMQRGLSYLAPTTISYPFAIESGTSLRVLVFAVLLSALSALLAGSSPALQAMRSDVNEALKEGGRAGGAGARSHRLRAALVVFEVALAFVALVGAGLFLSSLRAVRATDPGFEPRGVLVAQIHFSAGDRTPEEREEFCRRLRDRLESEPGVEAVSFADRIPLGFGSGPVGEVEVEGYVPRPGEDMRIGGTRIAPGYFALLRTPLVAGREFTAADGVGDGRVVIASESFARRFFGAEDPIGRRVGGRGGDWYTVVGVVRDSKANSLAESPRPYLFTPLRRDAVPAEMAVFVRTRGDEATSAATLRRDAAALDPEVGAFDVMPLRTYIDAPLFARRIAATLLTVLGTVALLLAAVGLYGLMAHAVGERTQEIGIRMAIGAEPADVLGMVVRRGMSLTAAGLLIGTLVALAVGRLVSSLLVDVSPWDPSVFAGATLFLGLVALAASGLPALRASRLDPAEALRRA